VVHLKLLARNEQRGWWEGQLWGPVQGTVDVLTIGRTVYGCGRFWVYPVCIAHEGDVAITIVTGATIKREIMITNQ
jgi:hypothetical protein